jgi:protein TonB
VARRTALIVLSLAVHAAFAVGIGQIHVKQVHASTAIAYAETKKKKPPEPAKIDPTPLPPKRERAAVSHRAAAPEPAEAPPPSKQPASAALDSAPDFGLSLSGTGDGTGIALPGAGRSALSGEAPRAVHKLVPIAAAAAALDDCGEPATKPRPRGAIQQPAFTQEALAAGIVGKVRVQLTVDETGRVIDVKLIQGLGYGLDEAAIAAARQASFEPAMHCGKAERATVKMAFSFLPS